MALSLSAIVPLGNVSARAANGLAAEWRVMPNVGLSGALLGAVSCARQTDCVAVGQLGRNTFIEQWDGARWTVDKRALAVVTVSAVAGTKYISTGLSLSGNVLVGAAAGAVVCLAGWWALHAEHRIRFHQGVYIGHEGVVLVPPRPGKPHAPVSTTLSLAVYVGFLAALVPGVVSGYHDSAHSRETQRDGDRQDGRIARGRVRCPVHS